MCALMRQCPNGSHFSQFMHALGVCPGPALDATMGWMCPQAVFNGALVAPTVCVFLLCISCCGPRGLARGAAAASCLARRFHAFFLPSLRCKRDKCYAVL